MYDFVPGVAILQPYWYKVRGKRWANIHKIVSCNTSDILEKIYKSTDLDDQIEKYISSLLYGLAARRFNKAAWGQLYQNEKEVENYSCGQILTELVPKLYLVIDRVQRELIKRYFPISHFFLNGMRILLHKLVSALDDNDAIALRTDAVHTTLSGCKVREKTNKSEFQPRLR